jgi:hypothetical protein
MGRADRHSSRHKQGTGQPCITLLALHLHQVEQRTFTSRLLSMPSTQARLAILVREARTSLAGNHNGRWFRPTRALGPPRRLPASRRKWRAYSGVRQESRDAAAVRSSPHALHLVFVLGRDHRPQQQQDGPADPEPGYKQLWGDRFIMVKTGERRISRPGHYNPDPSEGPWGRWSIPPHGGAVNASTDPTLCGSTLKHEGRRQTDRRSAHAGSRLKLIDASGRSRLTRQPFSRNGENSPYGMLGGIVETSASFEARSAPRSYPTTATVW